MSKSALKKYLGELKKRDLELQIMDLYERFPQVKTYYNFVFNPKEDKLMGEAKAKISNEYFPLKRRRARARRSVAQKFIKQYNKLGMDPHLLADLMLFNIETAQRYSASHKVNEAFYKSMLRSFREAVQHLTHNAILAEFKERLKQINRRLHDQEWEFQEDFNQIFELAYMDD
ncbi:DUF6155 family protein [Muriicola soli]|uniref:Uncharacterized protein n=1 Tax=Muriicola soli TaxID=2507538 RepID=A0A411E9H3_9FLAO|nr:DUF6155 family protein [Muriicola soli]QBA64184.1 hypothetical protein EQY75_06370 [Muriicola soli]